MEMVRVEEDEETVLIIFIRSYQLLETEEGAVQGKTRRLAERD